jgi:hypothetical protein
VISIVQEITKTTTIVTEIVEIGIIQIGIRIITMVGIIMNTTTRIISITTITQNIANAIMIFMEFIIA